MNLVRYEATGLLIIASLGIIGTVFEMITQVRELPILVLHLVMMGGYFAVGVRLRRRGVCHIGVLWLTSVLMLLSSFAVVSFLYEWLKWKFILGASYEKALRPEGRGFPPGYIADAVWGLLFCAPILTILISSSVKSWKQRQKHMSV